MTDQAVVIERRISAPIEKVFDAWTHVEILKEWFAPGQGYLDNPEADVRPGGSYRFAIVAGENRYVAFGQYLTVDRPNLLEFTWNWEESNTEKGTSIVTVELRTEGGTTDIKLIHTKLASAESAALHAEGWTSIMDRLKIYLDN